MSDEDVSSAGRYVTRARGQMEGYVRRLLEDNEALRVAQVELETANARLRQDATRLEEELRATHAEQLQLVAKLQEVRGESERRSAEYGKLEAVHANLANLYVASFQLHSTLERETVLGAIREIVVNLIGSEEFVVFERDGSEAFRYVTSVGMAGDDSVLAHERVLQATTSGETWISSRQEDLTACIPLKIDSAVTGVIVIRRLLPHKPGLEPLDLELFDLLATHAAMALYTSALQERLTRLARAV
jgi:hypothetical protein